MRWSEQQNQIFDWFREGSGNLIVRARAGTGKTTTILEAVAHAPERRAVLCAFNKRVAVELDSKIRSDNARAKTLHSIGYAIVRQNWESVRIDKNDRRLRSMVRDAMPATASDSEIRKLADLTTRTKEIAPHAGADDAERIGELGDRFSLLDPELSPKKRAQAIGAVLSALHRGATERGDITFADMLWLPVVMGWARKRWDLVVVDEAQDMSPVQIELAIEIASGRIAVVGDDRQAIYGFRGADSGSIDRLKRELSAKELGLHTTYRCGQAIVREAQVLVPDFRAAESNPAGDVLEISSEKMLEVAAAGDFILSRKNAPLVGLCLQLLRDGKRARIEGRDIGRGLLKLVNSIDARSMEEFFALLGERRVKELSAASKLSDADDAERKRGEIADRYDTVIALCDGVTSSAEVRARLESLFADGASDGRTIVLSSVHKAKGLESDRVFLLAATFSDRTTEELNIQYVAITRAKLALYWVTA